MKHNFETYRFIKQQIMILFSGTMKWNMFQIPLKEMRPLDVVIFVFGKRYTDDKESRDIRVQLF